MPLTDGQPNRPANRQHVHPRPARVQRHQGRRAAAHRPRRGEPRRPRQQDLRGRGVWRDEQGLRLGEGGARGRCEARTMVVSWAVGLWHEFCRRWQCPRASGGSVQTSGLGRMRSSVSEVGCLGVYASGERPPRHICAAMRRRVGRGRGKTPCQRHRPASSKRAHPLRVTALSGYKKQSPLESIPPSSSSLHHPQSGDGQRGSSSVEER